jgi:hypothetical protein
MILPQLKVKRLHAALGDTADFDPKHETRDRMSERQGCADSGLSIFDGVRLASA